MAGNHLSGNRSNRTRGATQRTHHIYAKSPMVLAGRRPRLERMVTAIYAEAPWLKPVDRPLVVRLAEAMWMAETAAVVLHRQGALNDANEPRRMVSEYRAFCSQQLAYSEALGLTPASRHRLGIGVDAKPVLDLTAYRAAVDTWEGANADNKSKSD